ncbi:MAG: hypothetical protein KJ062_07595 [Thermoanaerobaculia bacterium]|nr:hypothetical protein [Thermoanaerobaculia bacterium]
MEETPEGEEAEVLEPPDPGVEGRNVRRVLELVRSEVREGAVEPEPVVPGPDDVAGVGDDVAAPSSIT